MTTIGSVARLRRYPVKSMRGEDLSEAVIERHGMFGDRVYAFTIDNCPNPNLPWMTARHASEMLLYQPVFASIDQIDVISPDGIKYSIADEALEQQLEEKYGYQLSLRQDFHGCQDAKPISILGVQTIKQLEKEVGYKHLSSERFRANIYVDWQDGGPFQEDELVGRGLSIGGGNVQLRIVKKDSRCVIPTLDPQTTEALPDVLDVIKSKHNGYFGVYAEVESPGKIRRGDKITVF
jgi:uncharacterized protein